MLELYNNVVFGTETSFKHIYLKDGDGKYYMVNEADLLSTRFKCEDDYWDEYEWIKKDEKEGKMRLCVD